MTLRPLLVLGVAVLAASATTLAAGVPAGAAEPTADGSPTPSVSSSSLRQVDRIELDAESLVFGRADHVVTDVSMRDGRTTVSLLNRLLGTPSRSRTAEGDGGACFPAGTTYTWGGAVRVAQLADPAALGNAVEIRILRDHVRTRTGTIVELSGPDGVQVGDDIAGRIAHARSADRMSFGSDGTDAPSAWQLLLQQGWDDSGDGTSTDRATGAPNSVPAQDDAPTGPAQSADAQGKNGVSALTDDTTVTVLGSPMPVNSTSSC